MRIRKRAELYEKRAKRKKVLINAIKYLSNNNIPVKDYVEKQVFPKKPFELRGSEDFFDAVKFNDIKVVKEALAKNDHYLIQFDYFKQTPLHWAAKLGYHDILKVFLDYTKMINIYDKDLEEDSKYVNYFNKIILKLIINLFINLIQKINYFI